MCWENSCETLKKCASFVHIQLYLKLLMKVKSLTTHYVPHLWCFMTFQLFLFILKTGQLINQSKIKSVWDNVKFHSLYHYSYALNIIIFTYAKYRVLFHAIKPFLCKNYFKIKMKFSMRGINPSKVFFEGFKTKH
jgi:hypothetical protein